MRFTASAGSVVSMLGLPDGIRACLFDLDGVLTRTAAVHRAAWRAAFESFLHTHDPEHFAPFTDEDYLRYVDGKPRADGVRDFLASRNIQPAEGSPDDPPGKDTINGVGNGKNEQFLAMLRKHGAEVFSGSVRYLHAAKDSGLATAVVTSSANGAEVVRSTGLEPFVDTQVDGIVAAQRHLRGKPAPDTFLAAADALGVPASEAAVFEDALAGVAAGRAGEFGFVVGVDRGNQAADLRAHGADVVVEDLAELLGER